MEVFEINHQELEAFIEKCYQNLLPLHMWGTVGIGKSESTRKVAKRLAEQFNRKFVEWNSIPKDKKHDVAEHPDKYFFLMDIRLSQLDPSDLRGLPALNGKDTVEWKIPFWLHVATLKEAKGIIFFDEMNLAPPSIQASGYQIILDRALGEVTLAEGVGVIAAGNRISDKANVYEMSKPLQNRFNHVTLKVPNIESWTSWAITNGVDTRIIAFLNARPQLLMGKMDLKFSDVAFPTPRTWGKYCSRLIKGINDLDDIMACASASVGTGAATEFASFIKLQKQVNLQELLKHPETASDVKETDLLYSLVGLVSEWYDAHNKSDDLDKVLKIANNLRPEFAILMLRICKERHLPLFRRDVSKLQSWKKTWELYGKYFEV